MVAILMKLHSSTSIPSDPYGTGRSSPEGRRLMRKKDWVEGWWECLGPTPIYIKDKYHLKQVCEDIEKRTGRRLIPKAFMKTKSQGKGTEWNF